MIKKYNSKGFTITELVIATAVFSVVLMLGVVGFVQIGKQFYKGVSVSQTRDIASQIMNAITSDIRLSQGGVQNVGFQTTDPTTGTTTSLDGYCIGNHIYVVHTSYLVNLSQHDNSYKFGILQAPLPSNNNCPQPIQPSDLVNPVEMLGDNMRVSFLLLQNQLAGNLNPSVQNLSFLTDLMVTYGDDGAFTTGTAQSNDPLNPPVCNSVASGSQFCAVVRLTSTTSVAPTGG